MLRSYAARKFLPARRVFRTGRDAKPGGENVFLSIAQKEIIGYGEAGPNRYFGERADDVHMRLLGFADFLKRQALHSADDIRSLWVEMEEWLRPSRASLCAVDLALWDLWGKISRQTTAQALWHEAAQPRVTAVTLSVSDANEMEERLREVAGFPIVKVKLDARADLTVLRRLHETGTPRLWVDANASWTPEQCLRLLPELKKAGVELVEQPLPPSLNSEMKNILRDSPLPLIADESCAVPEDVEKLAGLFSGINIKLVKCGGLTPASQMVATARQNGLKVMVGCMLESSLSISAGLALAQKADWVDLDGSWLLAEDPFRGLTFAGGILSPSGKSGLGVELLSDRYG